MSVDGKSRLVYHRGAIIWATRNPDGSEYAHVLDVPNGLKCGCYCAECNEPLVARANRAGEYYVKEAHFAHRSNTSCRSTGIRGLVEAFRRVLSDAVSLTLPDLHAKPGVLLKTGVDTHLTGVEFRPTDRSNEQTIPAHLVLSTSTGVIRFFVMVRKSVPDWLITHTNEIRTPSIVALMEPDIDGMLFLDDVITCIESASAQHWLFHPEFDTLHTTHLDKIKIARREAARKEADKWREEREQTKRAFETAAARRIPNLPPISRGKTLSITGAISSNTKSATLRCASCKEHEAEGPIDGGSILCPTCKRHTLHWPT